MRSGAATVRPSVRPSVRQELALGAAEALSEGGWRKATEASQVDIWKTAVPAGHAPRPGLHHTREATARHSPSDL